MSKFYNYLNEKSFTMKDIPENFWVVFDLKEMKDELEKGIISGLKGISGSENIKFSFLGVARDAMLEMPSKDIIKDNKITRIMYNNPHYLVNKDMWALRRLFNAGSNWVDQVYGNLFDYLKKVKMSSKYDVIKYDMGYYGLRSICYTYDKRHSPNIPNLEKVKHISDLSKKIKQYTDIVLTKKSNREYDLSDKDYEKWIYEALLEIGRVYSDESEWVIKSSEFKIPNKSILYVLYPDIDLNTINKEAYEYIKKSGITLGDSMFSHIPVKTEMVEKGIIGDYKDIDFGMYLKVIELDSLIENIPFKIEKINNNEFKKLQQQYFERE